MAAMVATLMGFSIRNYTALLLCSVVLGLLHGIGTLVRQHDVAMLLGLPEPSGERVFAAALLGVAMFAFCGRILRAGMDWERRRQQG